MHQSINTCSNINIDTWFTSFFVVLVESAVIFLSFFFIENAAINVILRENVAIFNNASVDDITF